MNSHKTQSKCGSIMKYLRQAVLAESVWKVFKNREIICIHGEEMNQYGEISFSDTERWQVCRIVQCNGFNVS